MKKVAGVDEVGRGSLVGPVCAAAVMPDDPIVNDHYGDVLWQLDRKLQAKYFWEHVLELEDTEEEMKKDIENKLIDGPRKI